MDDNETRIALYRISMAENVCTLVATISCIGVIALATGSLHCLWGLLILLNLNWVTFRSRVD